MSVARIFQRPRPTHRVSEYLFRFPFFSKNYEINL
jgi:hypothetical protein